MDRRRLLLRRRIAVKMARNRDMSVNEAKASFAAAMDEIHPFKTIKEHPLAAVALTVLSGSLLGYVGLKVLKRAILAPNLTMAILKKIL